MEYLDTSVLMALYRQEPLTEAAEALVADRTDTTAAVSELTRTEALSVLSRWVRTREIDASGAEAIERAIAADLEAGALAKVSFPDTAWWRARQWIGRFDTSLGTLDALHLACAAEHGLTLVTADRTLADAVQALDTHVRLLEPSA